MKTDKNKKFLLAAAFAMVLSLSVGLTMSYFSDYTSAEGGSKLVLGATSKIVESVDENEKSVQIQNNGETNAVVRVAIYGPSAMQVNYDESVWEYKDGFYYYKGILAPDESGAGNGDITPAGTLVANTQYPAGTDLGEEYQIVVVQECIQPTYVQDGDDLIVDTPAAWGYIPRIVAQ